jgi:hypothetical protein
VSDTGSQESAKKAGATPPKGRSSTFRRVALQIYAVLGLAALIYLGGLFWLRLRNQFPLISPGIYAGSLDGIFDDTSSPSANQVILYRGDQTEEFSVAVLRSGWNPLRVPIAADERASGWLSPLMLGGIDAELRMRGSPLGNGDYVGVVDDIRNNRKGTWKLELLARPEAASERKIEDRRAWLILKSELSSVEDRIDAQEGEASSLTKRVDQLNRFVTEGKDLKAQAAERFIAVEAKLLEERKQLKTKRLEALQLEQQLALARQVTPMGRLVALARDSLERDFRWADSVTRTAAPTVTQDPLELKNAAEIVAIKEEIFKERERVFELLQQRGEQAQ